ncbi:MAG: efflux RND transporter periplasmic adaptor subunit [Desulfobacteraceae bacterium]|jgi:RND family efflux transporter MFP subunit
MPKKYIILICLIALSLALAGWYLSGMNRSGGGPGGPRPPEATVAVELAPVDQADISEIGDYTGSLVPLSEFVLAPKVSGRLEKIMVHIGDVVRDGDLVAVLDDEEYRQQVSQARAELEVTRASLQEVRSTLENARREFERTEELRKKKIASESQRDAAASEYATQQAKLKVAQAQVAQKEAALNIAKLRLLYTRIRVPDNSGSERVVGERFVDEGALLAPNTPIVSILDIGHLIAVIHVIEKDYFKLKPGQQAVITTDALPEKSFEGEVVRIAPLLKEKSREARVEVAIDNPGMILKPGMFIRLQILYAVHKDATVIPMASLVKRKEVQGVFQVHSASGKARFVPVTVGIVQGARAEILEPALKGQVVTLGNHLLEEGTAVLTPGAAWDKSAPSAGKGKK